MTTIGLAQVSKRYGRHMALDNASLSVYRGEILGLVGPNGAGKTTLLRIMAGLVKPTRGHVVPPSRTDGMLRYYGGEHTLPPNVSERRWRTLWRVTGRASTHPRPLGLLSRGTRQRLGLEAVLAAQGTALLLLDEPWEGLDPDASRWLSDELVRRSQRGVSILVSSHRIHDLAAICSRCEFLVRGRITAYGVAIDDGCKGVARADRLFRALDEARR